MVSNSGNTSVSMKQTSSNLDCCTAQVNFSDVLSPRVYSWLRVTGCLEKGLVFIPSKFFAELTKGTVYRRVPRYVQLAMARLVEGNPAVFGDIEVFASLDALEPNTAYMVVDSVSPKLHFGAIVWTTGSNVVSLNCFQGEGSYSIRKDKHIPSSLKLVRVSSQTHALPDVRFLFIEEVEDCG